jgi:hypothetical protein
VAKRQQHRQGVVYGPVRPAGRRDRGAIVGSLLGILVVVGTVGLLGFGIVTFLQQRPAAVPPVTVPSPSPAAAASASPVASPSGSVPPSPTAAPTAPVTTGPPPSVDPSAQPTAEITAPPTPFVPAVNVGPGYITFGTESNSQLQVTDAKTVFRPDERMVWSAYLTDTANSSDLRIVVLKLDPEAPDGQRLVAEDDVRPVANGVQRFLRRLRIGTIIDGPGLYTVRYLRGTEIMSEGSFLVSEEPT